MCRWSRKRRLAITGQQAHEGGREKPRRCLGPNRAEALGAKPPGGRREYRRRRPRGGSGAGRRERAGALAGALRRENFAGAEWGALLGNGDDASGSLSRVGRAKKRPRLAIGPTAQAGVQGRDAPCGLPSAEDQLRPEEDFLGPTLFPFLVWSE